MLLKLAGRHKEQDYRMDRLPILRVELESFPGTTKCADRIWDQLGGRVGNPDAEANARACGRLTFSDSFGDFIPMLRRDPAGDHQVMDQLLNRAPAGLAPQIDDFRLRTKEVA